MRAWDAVRDGQTAMSAASIGYFGTLAFFPLVAAMVAIAGMALNPEQTQAIVTGVTQLLP